MAHRNRLAGEASPYLRQHATNTVAWYPWGDEALALARETQRPIFLSIGYAACHWCHVMERETFTDPEVAAFLNARFVPVKVDREERPDLDAVYMSAVQTMTRTGGWPLNVFLTPQGEPFFGGTYFPPERRWGRPSFMEILRGVADAWEQQRPQLEKASRELVAHLSAADRQRSGGATGPAALERAALDSMRRSFDRDWGGFGRAPKFPSPARLFFLLRRARRDPDSRNMLAVTLDGMAAGGLFDWVGGGFHRYSVDDRWLVPHFEKMLYDNALLARLYGRAALALGEPRWTAVARATAEFILAGTSGGDGGFPCSTDADSEGGEGAYFTWTPEEIRAALRADEADAVIRACGVTAVGNFEDGRTILRPGPLPAEPSDRLEQARAHLLEARRSRPAPAVDDKRLASWNGMAVWALAWLGAALEEPRYVEAARRGGAFLLSLRAPGGRLVRSWRQGTASGAETLEDVAWVAAALVQLWEAEGRGDWLSTALALVGDRLPLYRDAAGNWYDTPADGEALILRPRDSLDGATPSAAGVLVRTVTRLYALTGREALRQQAASVLRAHLPVAARYPDAATALVDAAATLERPPRTLVVAGDPAWESTRALRAAALRCAPDDVAMALSPASPAPSADADLIPVLAGRGPAGPGRAAAYLCLDGVCRLPTEDPAELENLLGAL